MTVSDRAPPLVSVVVPTYNRASLLPEAIDSVCAQDYPTWELLVIDDGSTDDTSEILARYEAHSKIRIFRQPNSGQAVARNVGVRNACGEWVAFLDSDNRWLPHKLTVQMRYLEGLPNVDVLYGDVELVNLEGHIMPQSARMIRHSGIVWRQLLVDNFVSFNTSVVRASRLRDIGGFDERVRRADDYDLWLRLSRSARFQHLPGVVAQYRIEGERISTNVRGRLDSNLATVGRFLDANPGLLNAREILSLKSRIYGRFARAFAEQGQFADAIDAACRSVFLGPVELASWRTLAAVVIKPLR